VNVQGKANGLVLPILYVRSAILQTISTLLGGIIMNEMSQNLVRRRFMIIGSAAIASPLLLNVSGSIAAGKTPETKTTEPEIAPKGTKIYYIGAECVGCQACKTFCPAQAIRFGNCRNEIDQKKCIHCGTCYRECNISVITETILS
jgi:coenzyme F420-reducing hydrogenase gamma subunit